MMTSLSLTGVMNASCFSAVKPVIGWNQWVKCVAPFSIAQSFMALGDDVGDVAIQLAAALNRAAERLVILVGQAFLHHRIVEHHRSEQLLDFAHVPSSRVRANGRRAMCFHCTIRL